jgi:hypothetical protein
VTILKSSGLGETVKTLKKKILGDQDGRHQTDPGTLSFQESERIIQICGSKDQITWLFFQVILPTIGGT